MLRIIFIVLIFTGFIFPQQKQLTEEELIDYPNFPNGYVCKRPIEIIQLDGINDEYSWKIANEIDINSKNGMGELHSVKFLWDDISFYTSFAVENEDQYKDTINIFLDPEGYSNSYLNLKIANGKIIWLNYYEREEGLKYIATKSVNLSSIYFNSSKSEGSHFYEVGFPINKFFSNIKKNKIIKFNIDLKSKSSHYYLTNSVEESFEPDFWPLIQLSYNVVSNKSNEFVDDYKNFIIWQLRRIYFAESLYRTDNGKFTDNIKKLPVIIDDIPNTKVEYLIKVTDNKIRIVAYLKDKKYALLLDEKCRVFEKVDQ